MNKYEYINRLKTALADLPIGDREEIIADYNEHFRIGLEEGKSEEQTAAYLGLPETVAAQFMADYGFKPKPPKSSGIKTLIILALIFFNICFVFGPFMGIVGTLIGFFFAGFGITLGGALLIIFSALSPVVHAFANIPFTPIVGVLTGIGLTCLGVLWAIGTYYLTKLFYKGILAYFNLMKKLVNE